MFALHANINEEMNGREAGTISRDILKMKDDRWTYWDPNARLKKGDIIYYWTYVDFNDGERTLGYAKDDQNYTVSDLLHLNQANRPSSTKPTTTTTTTTTPKPKATTKKPTNPRQPQCQQKGITIVNGQPTCPGQVIFEDDFTIFDKAKWKQEVKLATKPVRTIIFNNNNRLFISETLPGL